MGSDNIKLAFTYATAMVLVIGGLLFLYGVRGDPSSSDLKVVVAGFIGSALTFLFSSETATRATRAATAATAAGVSATPTVTTSSGPPASVTVTPSTDTTDTAG